MKKKIITVLVSLCVGLVILSVVGYFYITSKEYQPSRTARFYAKYSNETNDFMYFKSSQKIKNKPLVIFYPGALVEEQSYSIWAHKLQQDGYSVAIARFPLDLALITKNRANKLTESKSVKSYVIGGHSLGGVMASRYAASHQNKLKGVFFLASYPDEKGCLKNLKVPVLSVTGSKDGILNKSKYNQAKKYLPNNTTYEVIKGGNHGGFGSYGNQKGDKKATISNIKQQQQLAYLLEQWLNKIR